MLQVHNSIKKVFILKYTFFNLLKGWSEFIFDEYTLNCLFNRKAKSYIISFIFFSIILPFILITYFYSKIYLKVRSVAINTADSNGPMRIIKGLFASCVLFIVCYLPYGFVVISDDGSYPKEAHMFPMALLHLNSTLNPFLYFFTNTPIREGYKNFFNFLFRRSLYKFK